MAFIQSLLLVQSEKGQSKLLGEVTDFFFQYCTMYYIKILKGTKKQELLRKGLEMGLKGTIRGKFRKPMPPPLPLYW